MFSSASICNLHWCYSTFCTGVTSELHSVSANQNRVIFSCILLICLDREEDKKFTQNPELKTFIFKLIAKVVSTAIIPNLILHFISAFETVPSPKVTAKKLITNFLGYGQASINTKRSPIIEDIVIVLDGSGSVGSCEFKKGKEALKHMMKTAHNPRFVSKYAAVTFASSVTVNFKFLSYLSAASKITNIPYPGGMTNTQAGLAEAKKLFDDPTSGILYIC